MNRSLLQPLLPQAVGLLLERLLAIADDAVIVTDEQFLVVLFNQGAERAFGHRAADVLGQPLDQLLPDSARAVHSQHMRRFADSDRASRRMGDRRDLCGRRRDGTLFDAEASISHLAIDGHTYYTAILRDVTEARRAAHALLRSEARFRMLASAAPVGIFQADGQGRIVYVNERWCRIAAIGEADAQGQAWLHTVHADDRPRVLRAWQDAVAQQQPFEQRFRFVRGDGNEAWVLANAVPWPEGDGHGAGHIGTITDVTDSHRQALTLQQATLDAESAVRAKSLFLANMSHEIRTPLNAVVGMTSLLLDTPMSDDQRDFARTIRASSETLLEIINDILDFSKADVGKLEIEQQLFDLRRCVEDALDLVASRAQEKGLNLAYLIEDGTPERLVGDASRLRQILVNLLSNAVKFTHQGEVFVMVEAGTEVDGRLPLHLAVQDSGIGIAAEHLPRLFHSFSQVDASTTRKYGGTGLGLAISKRLAEMMGGTVTVSSEPGKGSVFHVTVSVASVPGHTGDPAYLQRNVPLLAGKRLLIVDDNLTNRRILTRMALRWGMLPSTLPSALEALDHIRHGEPFDLAVLDMSMPDIDGLALAEQIRKRRTPDELPIVMLTSLGQRLALPEHQRAMLSAFLSKPIKAGELFETLGRALRGLTTAPLPPPPPPAITRPLDALPMRVLVAEDNPINQRVALRLLERLGLRADLAANGLEVLDAVERQRYELILMDIQMPEMDGLQAARWIIQRRGNSGLPRIVAMTANAMPGDRERFIEAGIDGYLPKPIDPEQLATVLRSLPPPEHDSGGANGRAVTERPEQRLPVGASDELVLDLRRMDHLRAMQDDSQPTLVADLINLFLADAGHQVQDMARALEQRQFTQLRAMAHRFLSSTQNIGASRVSVLCQAIEDEAHRHADHSLRALLEHLQVEVDLAGRALAELRAGPG